MAPPSNPAFLPLDYAPPPERRAQERLRAIGRSRRIPAGTAVVAPGRPSACAHVVIDGLLVAETVATTGRQFALALLRPGDLFGESTLVPDLPPGLGCCVRALTAATVLSVLPRDLEAALASDRELGRWIRARLVDRLHRTQTLLLRAVSLPVPDRLVAILDDLAGARAEDEGTGEPPHLTQETLAGLVGASRESVNRAVASLVRQGRLVRAGRLVSRPLREDAGAWTPARRSPTRDLPSAGPVPRPPA